MAETDSWSLVSARVSCCTPILGGLAYFHFDSVLQLVEPVHRHDLTSLKAGHGGNVGLAGADGNVLYCGRIVRLNDIYKRLLGVSLDGRGGHEDDAVLRLHQEVGIDELIGE